MYSFESKRYNLLYSSAVSKSGGSVRLGETPSPKMLYCHLLEKPYKSMMTELNDTIAVVQCPTYTTVAAAYPLFSALYLTLDRLTCQEPWS